MKNGFFYLLFLFVIFSFISCASFSSNVKITSSNDFEIVNADGKKHTVKANEIVSVEDPFLVLKANGKIPTYLILNSSNIAKPLTIDLKPVQAWKPKETEALMNSIALDIIKIYEDSFKKNVGKVASRVDRLVRDYPDQAFPFYLRALVELQNGEKEKAKRSLEQSIKLNPGFEPAYEVIKEIGGNK